MSSPVVENVRTIPLIIERSGQNYIPMEIVDNSGFPFERESDRDRDGHFRSQLDDIAKRHPEFAEHLGSFSRRRQSSGEDTDEFHRRFERPFAGRFGFPFDRDNFDPEQYAQQFYQQRPDHQHPQPESYQQQQPTYQQQQPSYQHQQQPSYQSQHSYQPQYQPQPEYQQPQPDQQQCSSQQTTENPPTTEAGRSNIQQSSTIDLGQKQEPVNDRNQRSMSAPPTEKGQRFTSSINIPVNQPSESGENMAQTQGHQQNDAKTTERIIPIHIEGRDEPVLPKTASPTFSQPHSAGPQPERIFGQRPEHFTQFVNREPRQYEKWHRPGFEQMHQGFSPEELLRQQRYPQQNVPPFYQQQQQQRPATHQVPPQPQPKEEIPIPVQKEVPQTKQQAPQQQTAPPQPKPASPQPKPAPQQQKPHTPIDQIQAIQKDVSELLGQVEKFAGKPRDKQYLYLDEMLTRNLLKLDNIDTQGQESIRSARKEAIKCIEKAISVLEAKAAANVQPGKTENTMEVEDKSQDTKESEEKQQTEAQTMEAEPITEPPSENQLQPMELSPENLANQEPAPIADEKTATENSEKANPVVEETRAVLVTSENKETQGEPMEAKEVPPAVTAEGPKSEETCEGQESNLPVAEAVKKFEGADSEKKEESKTSEVQKEEKVEGKKDKKKGKKKVEKKEK